MIDMNEDEIQEYPSHMREEDTDNLGAGEQVIADRNQEILEGLIDQDAINDREVRGIAQQLHEAEQNRQAYEGLTEERLREVVDEVLEEADPQPIIYPPIDPATLPIPEPVIEETPVQRNRARIDVGNIPVGMSPEEFIRHYINGSAYFINTAPATVTSYTDDIGTYMELNQVYGDTSTGTTTIPTDITWGPPPTAGVQVDVPEEVMRLPPEEVARIRAAKKKLQERQLQYRREIRVRDLKIDSNDLIITFHDECNYNFYHIDLEGRYNVGESRNGYQARRRRQIVGRSISNDLFFDKHMNYLIINVDGYAENGVRKTVRTGQRIYGTQVTPWNGGGDMNERRFIIVDKNTFISSKGRIIKLKRRQDIPYTKIIKIKRHFSDLFDKMDRFLVWMKTHIDEIHPQEDYDIMYNMNGSTGNNKYALLLKFRDVTIQNSLEMEHHIGDIFIRSSGQNVVSHSSSEIRCSLTGSVYGTRLGFTPADAALNYQHSHLTSTMTNFGGFCTGHENYHHGEGYMTPIELQAHIIRLSSFIQWESLEGGPHNKMENINIHGPTVPIKPSVMKINRQVTSGYVNALINEINKTEQKFTVFSDCFSLVNCGDENLKFVADYDRFYEKFIGILDNQKLTRLHNFHNERTYTYNPIGRTFHKTINNDMTDSNKIIKKARDNIRALTPIYMNGKYHKPYLTTLSADDILQGVRFCPEPNFMKEVAQMILYKLTDKLEKYGNSSENA